MQAFERLKHMEKAFPRSRWFWFFGGLGAGVTAISLSQASVPKRITPKAPAANENPSLIREMKTSKISAPDLEGDFSGLSRIEKSFSESAGQQLKLKEIVAGDSGRVQPRQSRKQ